jgi:hypothetical protein
VLHCKDDEKKNSCLAIGWKCTIFRLPYHQVEKASKEKDRFRLTSYVHAKGETNALLEEDKMRILQAQ